MRWTHGRDGESSTRDKARASATHLHVRVPRGRWSAAVDVQVSEADHLGAAGSIQAVHAQRCHWGGGQAHYRVRQRGPESLLGRLRHGCIAARTGLRCGQVWTAAKMKLLACGLDCDCSAHTGLSGWARRGCSNVATLINAPPVARRRVQREKPADAPPSFR